MMKRKETSIDIYNMLINRDAKALPYSKEEFRQIVDYCGIDLKDLAKQTGYVPETLKYICSMSPSKKNKNPSPELSEKVQKILDAYYARETCKEICRRMGMDIWETDSISDMQNKCKHELPHGTVMTNFKKFDKERASLKSMREKFMKEQKKCEKENWKSFLTYRCNYENINNFRILKYENFVNHLDSTKWNILDKLSKQDDNVLDTINSKLDCIENKGMEKIFNNIFTYIDGINFIKELELENEKEREQEESLRQITEKALPQSVIELYDKREVMKGCGFQEWKILLELLGQKNAVYDEENSKSDCIGNKEVWENIDIFKYSDAKKFWDELVLDEIKRRREIRIWQIIDAPPKLVMGLYDKREIIKKCNLQVWKIFLKILICDTADDGKISTRIKRILKDI